MALTCTRYKRGTVRKYACDVRDLCDIGCLGPETGAGCAVPVGFGVPAIWTDSCVGVRSMKFLALLFVGACAGSQPHYTNVAAVRHEISDQIDHDASSGSATKRSIVSMGHTTNDEAVIFTQTAKDSPKREETWVHDGDQWKMKESKDLAGM